ncbi:MAG: hypothetical protein IPM37_08370 [Hahellaceae bacterium]|nr:hypothetical protein [Hahellaceae bacterium]
MMSRLLFATAFFLGAAATVWMGIQFLEASLLGLCVIALVGLVFSIGAVELLHFRRATTSLNSALSATKGPTALPPTTLESWLAGVHDSLQNAVRLRIEGERVAMPNPVLTPYLVSLLVMLGLLGTFAGMVVTLKGTVVALEGTTNLEAIRAGLTAPIGGLGLAFGTSVAGVAASAMLGLMSTLSRRDRMLAARELDHQIPRVFRPFSRVLAREATYQALQAQSAGLPVATEKLTWLTEEVSRLHTRLTETLAQNQTQFHQTVERAFQGLARDVSDALKTSLAKSARLTGENIRPVLENAVTELTRTVNQTTQETLRGLQDTHLGQMQDWAKQQEDSDHIRLEAWQATLSTQQDASHAALSRMTDQVNAGLTSLLDQHTQTNQQLREGIDDLLRQGHALSLTQQEQTRHWQAQNREEAERLLQQLEAQLTRLRDQETQRSETLLSQMSTLEGSVARHLGTLGQALEAPMTRLIETASETPRAAAEVIGQLREELTRSMARDNALLEERQQLMQGLQSLSSRLSGQVETEVSRIAEVSELFAGSAAEMASLGEAFGYAMNLYHESNDRLAGTLERIEQALQNATQRSDEQLGYYVAQAREVIDHSVHSQKEIFEEIRQLGQKKQAEVV